MEKDEARPAPAWDLEKKCGCGSAAIARWRVIGLVVLTLWAGAMVCGLAFDKALAAGLF